MGARRNARKAVLMALYACTIRGFEDASDVIKTIIDDYVSLDENDSAFADELFNMIVGSISDIDTLIQDISSNWDIERISMIDRNIIRMGIAEILFLPDIASEVSIDEAVELAKYYSSSDSARFVNGILDAVMKRSVQV